MSELQRRGPFVPRNYDVFAGLDVDKTSIAATFADHEGTIKSMHIPYGDWCDFGPMPNQREHGCGYAFNSGKDQTQRRNNHYLWSGFFCPLTWGPLIWVTRGTHSMRSMTALASAYR